MTNEQIFEKVHATPNTVIHSLFHMAQYNGSPLYDFVKNWDVMDVKYLLPKISTKKIQKAMNKNEVITLLLNNGVFGFIAEVSYRHIAGYDGTKYTTNDSEHCVIVYSEDFEDIINKILNLSEEYIKSDVDKLKEKGEIT